MAEKYRYPIGARPLLMEETARRRALESRLVAQLAERGFSEIVLPIIDFAEPYAGLTGSDAARRSYRFTDRDGELVAVRADFTPMVARALAPSLTAANLPLGVFYRGDVVRCEPTRLGSNRELFQIGAELIGDASIEADLAMLELAMTIARGLVSTPLLVFSDASLIERFDGETRQALRTKRIGGSVPTLARRLIAGTATLDDVREIDAAIAARLGRISAALGDDASFALQLDDAEPSGGYYTALRFRLFGEDRRTPIAEGGRYDSLYGRFGLETPAIGFTFTIDERRGPASRNLALDDAEAS